MTDIDSTIHALYQQQSSRRYPSEKAYRDAIDEAAKELSEQQPKNIGLQERSFRVLVVSMIKDHLLSLDEVKRRIRARTSSGRVHD